MALDNSAILKLENMCEALKPGTEQVIRLTQEELNKHLTSIIDKK
jgi:hypothetical protein